MGGHGSVSTPRLSTSFSPTLMRSSFPGLRTPSYGPSQNYYLEPEVQPIPPSFLFFPPSLFPPQTPRPSSPELFHPSSPTTPTLR